MQLLEKDIHDKQDTLISLRRQLQDIKTINLDLHTKWQVYNYAITFYWEFTNMLCTSKFFLYAVIGFIRARKTYVAQKEPRDFEQEKFFFHWSSPLLDELSN
jgi:hypothetical protein